MSKLKSLSKKLKRLESSIQKDAKKLAKLQRKVEMALKAETVRARTLIPITANSKPEQTAAPVKKKRMLTAEGRAKLAALMKARWEAKRAASASSSNGGGEHRF
jgi:hypothetical protein